MIVNSNKYVNLSLFYYVFIDAENVAVMAGLHSGSSLATMYESLYNQARKVKSIKKLHAFQDSGLEQDEFADSLNNLLDCKEAYEDHYI